MSDYGILLQLQPQRLRLQPRTPVSHWCVHSDLRISNRKSIQPNLQLNKYRDVAVVRSNLRRALNDAHYRIDKTKING